VCDRWLAKRQEIQSAEQAHFDESWANLKALLTQSPKALKRRQRTHLTDEPE
jgi:hypothetical protein